MTTTLHSAMNIFQFHKGTIKTVKGCIEIKCPAHFNSIKVRLKHEPCEYLYRRPSDFNSIKVRLKRIKPRSRHSAFLFQFHKGTIKTATFVCISFTVSDFNSIKVRLKLRTSIHCCMKFLDFNSIKVRLKQRSNACAGIQYDNFNSIKVRLKHRR